MTRVSILAVSAVAALAAMGCAKKPANREVATIPVTASVVPRRNVNVSDELARLCKLHVDDVEHAPKFDFDDSELLPEDRDVLAQVAKCVTTGPLAGRSLTLVGRADPRGETEYNMALGDHRAGTVHAYLAKLGVPGGRLTATSRGELDAQGVDEDGWARDRRVDVHLEPVNGSPRAHGAAEP